MCWEEPRWFPEQAHDQKERPYHQDLNKAMDLI